MLLLSCFKRNFAEHNYLKPFKTKKMKATKITFWISTTIIFLFEGVMPASTSQSEVAKEGMRHLGYPMYFSGMLAGFKVLGTLALIIPAVPMRIKEWANAGFAFNFLAACFSYLATDGAIGLAFFPLIIFALLITSYICYHKINGTVKLFSKTSLT